MAIFSLPHESNVRMAVLEEKLNVYEELSREMLTKLEIAVDKISEANQNVARVLVRHEERLDQSLQSDAAIMKLLDEIKEQRKSDIVRVDIEIKELKTHVDGTNTKIQELSKYRWVAAGVLVILTFIIAESNMISRFFGTDIEYSRPRLERTM